MTLSGFPGLELTGPSSNGSTTFDPVRRAVDTPSTVVVPPGLNAVAAFTALPGPDVCDAGTAWVPYNIDVTPPDETTSLPSSWPGTSVDNCQNGATHPGTYIGVFRPGTSASPLPPLTATGAGAFAGAWYHHGIAMTIAAAGNGTADWRTYSTCGQDPPPCDTFAGNVIEDGGHATFTVTAATATTANVQVLASTDRKEVPLGSSTMTLDLQNQLLYWSDWGQTAFCGTKSAPGSPCGS